MRIDRNNNDIRIHDPVRGVSPAAPSAGSDPLAPTAPVKPADRVELSDEARALAARLEESGKEELTPERIAELRQRIQQGAYSSPEAAEQLAQRLLESGDL